MFRDNFTLVWTANQRPSYLSFSCGARKTTSREWVSSDTISMSHCQGASCTHFAHTNTKHSGNWCLSVIGVKRELPSDWRALFFPTFTSSLLRESQSKHRDWMRQSIMCECRRFCVSSFVTVCMCLSVRIHVCLLTQYWFCNKKIKGTWEASFWANTWRLVCVTHCDYRELHPLVEGYLSFFNIHVVFSCVADVPRTWKRARGKEIGEWRV